MICDAERLTRVFMSCCNAFDTYTIHAQQNTLVECRHEQESYNRAWDMLQLIIVEM